MRASPVFFGLFLTACNSSAAWVPAHHVIAKHSGLFLGIREGLTEDEVDAIQWTDSGGDEQRFEIVPGAAGAVRLRAVHSRKYLAVLGERSVPGARVVQTTDGSAPGAQWRMLPTGGGWFRVAATDAEQCLAVSRAETGIGSRVIQWPCSDGDEQLWRFVLANAPDSAAAR